MEQDCLFCKIRDNTVPSFKVYEDEDTLAFLDINPVSKGHTLLIPREHAENLTEGSEASAVALVKALKKLAPMLTQALGASGYNLGMNHGKDAGQLIYHTHMHLMPRYEGMERTFTKRHPSQDELQEVADQIRRITMPE